MAQPCIRDTPSTTMSQDIAGDVGVDVNLHAPDPGLGIVADGLYVNNYSGGGLVRTSQGMFGRQYYGHVGWSRGVNDIQNPGTAVGAGGYVQVGDYLALNFQRQGPVLQYIHITAGAEINVGPSDLAENPFYGWSVSLESWYDFSGVWLEECRQGTDGYVNASIHQLRMDGWVLIGEDAVHTVLVRITMRGGLAGTAIARQTHKRWVHVDYH